MGDRWAVKQAGWSGPATARWLPLLSRGARSPWPLALAAGLVGAHLSLVLAADGGASALGVGVRAMLACWAALTLAEVGRAMARGTADAPAKTPGPAGRTPGGPGRSPAESAPPEGLMAVSTSTEEGSPQLTAGHVVFGAAALLAAALQRSPSRLVVNLLGFGLIAVPLVWVVRRRVGPAAAASAAAALAVFAVFPTHVDLRQAPSTEKWRADSPFRWTVGWPSDGWILRHEIRLDRPATARPMRLIVPIAGDAAAQPAGPGQVFATMNGQDLGPLRPTGYESLVVDIPAELLAGRSRLTFELRQAPVDASLRIVAQRWTGGAGLGPTASSFYDTQRWWPGTFNDLVGKQQAGVYILELGESP